MMPRRAAHRCSPAHRVNAGGIAWSLTQLDISAMYLNSSAVKPFERCSMPASKVHRTRQHIDGKAENSMHTYIYNPQRSICIYIYIILQYREKLCSRETELVVASITHT